MSNPAIYWFPRGTTTPRKVDLGTNISALALLPERVVSDAAPIGGPRTRHDFGGQRSVRLWKSRITSALLVRELRSLTSHLHAGGSVLFCRDPAKLWGGWATARPVAGDTVISIYNNAFAVYAAGSIAVGDEVTIESPNPEYLQETAVVTGVTGNTITIGAGVIQTYGIGPVFVRFSDLYPVLRVGEGELSSVVPATERRISWEFDASLVELPGEIEALSHIWQSIGAGSPGSGVLSSLDGLLSAWASDRSSGERQPQRPARALTGRY